MPCGQYPYGQCRTNNTRGLLSRPTLGRLAYLNRVQSKPAPTRNYGSEDARARAIRRRALGKIVISSGDSSERNIGEGVVKYGPMFGLKQNDCRGQRLALPNVFIHANHGDSSDVTYFKRVAAGQFIILNNACTDKEGVIVGCCNQQICDT